ncbi:hypothetical protein BKA70DRAFT_1503108 [Coprinopsis sp. MPI-PUGE-AT-0042]|nr:hypothetical protein BKA70DRAFT_1503108 [Coprinopsis sp. MPI-PUGE-AT-0042]
MSTLITVPFAPTHETSPYVSGVRADIPGVSLSQHPEFLSLTHVHPDYIAELQCTSDSYVNPNNSTVCANTRVHMIQPLEPTYQHTRSVVVPRTLMVTLIILTVATTHKRVPVIHLRHTSSFQNGSGPSHRCTDTENMPPTQSAKGATTKRNRLLTVIHSEKSTAPSASSSKERLDQAKKRKMFKKSKSKDPLKLRVPMPSSSAANDVQIKDGEVAPALQTIPLNLPRYLSKPNFRPIPRRALQRDPHGRFHEAGFSQGEVSDVISPHLFTMLGRTAPASVPRPPLPSQVDAIVSDYVSDDRAHLPTHMVAVWGSQAPQRPRQITLYPVHQEVMQLQRAHLPIPEQTRAETPSSQPQNIQITLPVQSLCLPSPESYAPLARYIYHKDTLRLLNELLPVRPPADFEDNQAQIPSFGTFIGRNCEMKDILSRVMLINGLWKDACALAVHDDHDGLWDTIELAWEVMLTALAVALGKPELMIEDDSQP